MKNIQIDIQDEYNHQKFHVFRFYKDYHVTYNQKIAGRVFYSKFIRVNRAFGYSEALLEAKIARKELQK